MLLVQVLVICLSTLFEFACFAWLFSICVDYASCCVVMLFVTVVCGFVIGLLCFNLLWFYLVCWVHRWFGV